MSGVGSGVPSFPPPQPPPSSHPPLPPGWEQAIDPASGSAYYANRSTGETSWTPPFPPPLPVIPPPQVMQQPQHLVHQPSQHFIPQGQQFIYAPSAQPPVVAQPPIVPMIANLSGHNASAKMQQPNYPQQYLPPNQVHQVEMNPSITQTLPPNTNIPTPQQQESQTTVTHNSSGLGLSTSTTPGLLVPSVRAMIDVEYTQRSKGAAVPKLELEGLSAGVIADLCNVTREMKSENADKGDFAEALEGTSSINHKKQGGGDDEDDQYYVPLQPFALPVSSVPPHIEPGRVDIRLHALQSKLGKI